MPLVKEKYVRPEQKSVVRKRHLILGAIRFVKRMANIPELPGSKKFDLGGQLMNNTIQQGLFREIIAALQYAFKNGEKQIINEAIEGVFNISRFGKMALR